ncbi:hypothetical protein FRAHR75_1380008 [Frankia sp. Hr75.2]|nr:hypothetical protein FRAHR75_1380008 [Frankia sp. Hr75.2]
MTGVRLCRTRRSRHEIAFRLDGYVESPTILEVLLAPLDSSPRRATTLRNELLTWVYRLDLSINASVGSPRMPVRGAEGRFVQCQGFPAARVGGDCQFLASSLTQDPTPDRTGLPSDLADLLDRVG